MSYILNALRKSERERMALQADTVTDRILVNQPQPRHKTGKLMLLLMLSNVIAVASLVWYVRKEPNTPLGASQQTSAPEKIQLKPESVESIRIIPKLKSEPASPALAELAASKKAPVEPHPAIKAVVEKQPEPTQAKSDSVTEMAPESSTETQLEPVDMIEQKPEAKIENKTIPFLFELDRKSVV